jgi:tryptophanyl-tRNA synthetase
MTMSNDKSMRLDPWGTSDIKDYSELFELFGIEPIENLINKISDPGHYLRRSIIFGHRELAKIMNAIEKNEEYAVMSGIKPTGALHLGSKMTAEEIIYFQSLSKKSKAFYAIADVEAYCDNGLPFTETAEIAVNNLADILALGLKPERAYVYKQSEEIRVMNLALIFSRKVTKNTIEAIYGERPFGLYLSALVQAGDILLPQLKDFGGPKPVLVPVGADQDPHIRLTRDLARKHYNEFKFILPSATYHKLIRSLTGDFKMSKRDPMSLLTLDDPPDLAKKKVMNCYTGGRETISEQKKYGGEPEKCVPYELCLFHFCKGDDKVKEMYQECGQGGRTCGDCKAEIAEIVANFLSEHQQKKRSMIPIAQRLLERD